MARELGIDWRVDPAEKIISFCIQRITGWISEFEAGSFSTMAKVERLICAKLKLVIEEVDTEEKMSEVIEKYAVQKGEGGAFAHLREDLNQDRFGVLLRRERAKPSDRDHFVAVVDARGDKAARAYFSRWHEIAHLLTLYDQLVLPFHRSKSCGDPIERLMDMIAGEIGFYGPIFRPALEEALSGQRRISFGLVDSLQTKFAPTASFQATLIACLKQTALAAAYVEAGWGYKKAELELINSGQLLLGGVSQPEAKLRVLNCSSNAGARDGKLRFHQNMEVPSSSIVSRRFHGVDWSDGLAQENLKIWRHSSGSNLGDLDVEIETRRIRDRLIVLVNPA